MCLLCRTYTGRAGWHDLGGVPNVTPGTAATLPLTTSARLHLLVGRAREGEADRPRPLAGPLSEKARQWRHSQSSSGGALAPPTSVARGGMILAWPGISPDSPRSSHGAPPAV